MASHARQEICAWPIGLSCFYSYYNKNSSTGSRAGNYNIDKYTERPIVELLEILLLDVLKIPFWALVGKIE